MRECATMLAAILPVLLAGCSGSDESRMCVQQVERTILNGTPEATQLELSRAELAALAAVEAQEADLLCTAALVHPDWALTAAHCDVPGLVFYSSDARIPPVSIDGRVVHDSLDLMLVHLELQTPATPIGLYRGRLGNEWLDREVTLAGLGLTEHETVGDLLFAVEPIVKLDTNEIVVDGRGRTGACIGDSGGPILATDSGGRPRLLGALRRGDASCLGLDYYVRVDRFADWVDTHAGTQTTPRCAPLE